MTSVVPAFPVAATEISIVVLVKTIVVLVFPAAAPVTDKASTGINGN